MQANTGEHCRIQEDASGSTLKNELGSYDAISLMFKGTDISFSTNTIALRKLYQNIFGKEMWKNVIVEMSFWKHTEREGNNDGLDEERLATKLNAKVYISEQSI